MDQNLVVYDAQPVVVEGVRSLLKPYMDLSFCESYSSLKVPCAGVANIVLVDNGFGMEALLNFFNDLRQAETRLAIVVWGGFMTQAEILELLRAGACGIIRKTADLSLLLECLRAVADGRNWIEDSLLKDSSRSHSLPLSKLTRREQQVLKLVEQGFKNKEIGNELGICPGTVKIHLKHIFEKTGVRGRYGLWISVFQGKGTTPLLVTQ